MTGRWLHIKHIDTVCVFKLHYPHPRYEERQLLAIPTTLLHNCEQSAVVSRERSVILRVLLTRVLKSIALKPTYIPCILFRNHSNRLKQEIHSLLMQIFFFFHFWLFVYSTEEKGTRKSTRTRTCWVEDLQNSWRPDLPR